MGRAIGNEVFKNIVTMAYEMGLAQKVLNRMTRRRDKVEELMRTGQTFRDDDDIRKEMTKYLAISHTNKKHWRYDDDAEEVDAGYVLKKEIALSVSGRYRIMLSIVKHTSPVVVERRFPIVLYIHIRDSDGDEMAEDNDVEAYRIENRPTVFTVEIIKRLGLCLEFSEVKEAYDEIFVRVSPHSGRNAQRWNERITKMRVGDKGSVLVKKIYQRYGQDI